MKPLTEDLKRMLNALAMQDVVDYLPRREKMNVLGCYNDSSNSKAAAANQSSVIRRVAVLSDGRGSHEALNYALNACQNQNASLDLVLYGEAREQVEELRNQLQCSGIAYEIILLGRQSVVSLTDYLNGRHSLTYLVAPADDPLALELTEEASPSKGGRLHLPMVLVDRTAKSRINRFNTVNVA